MGSLFSQLQLRETTVPNRVMVSPMCQYSCENRDGIATDWHFVHLGSRAIGGAGVVMTEATAVEPRGRISPEDLGIWNDEQVEAFAPITSFIRSQGSIPAIQLAHAGRKASKHRPWEGSTPISPTDDGWQPIAPTARAWPYETDAPTPAAMDQTAIDGVVASFRSAAERALQAGFEIAEIHAAHGYLLHEFLSPVTNDRTDEYGGSFENRIRLLKAVVTTVRSVWPDDKPVFVRLSATDWLDDRPSWTVEQSVRLASHLYDLGVDLIDVSAGGIHPEQAIPETGPGYQLEYAGEISDATGCAVGAVGGLGDPELADAVVRTGTAALAIVGREHLRDPQFTLRAATELQTDEQSVPSQYARAYPSLASD
ncbi:NADH:flavin oxidoreductase/NADH oxidase [Halocatena halophila]|uniref:NADH:flavin oxidoreductase/NADH oxidase n=1 Tax=Halocatena halophila TaxID=2814576 RepID=UPI002ED1D990